MSSFYTFNWPAGPHDVIVTGTFDDWAKSLPMVKQTDGSFELTVPFAKDSRILYKYVVDGEWLTNPAQSTDKDSNGIENNVLTPDHLFTSDTHSSIPEAGGLGVIPGSLNTTVLPSTEGQQTTLGEPGIFVPKDKDSLAAFNTYENTDRNLNEPSEEAAPATPESSTEEAKKQKKKLKRTRHKLNKKAKSAGTSTSESSPEPEDHHTAALAAGAAGAAALGATAVGVHEDGLAKAAAKEAYGSNSVEDSPATAVTSAAEAEEKAGVPTKDALAESKNGPASALVAEEITVEETVVTAVPGEKDVPVEGETEAKEAALHTFTEEDLAASTVVPTEGKTEESVGPEKEAAPYALTEKDIPASTVVPAAGKAAEDPALADKEPAPYALTENDIPDSTVVAKPAEEEPETESKNTLDPTVIGVVGAAAGAGALAGSAEAKSSTSADAVAAEISQEKAVEPSIQPAIGEPIESPKELASPVEQTFAVPSVEEPIKPAEEAATTSSAGPTSPVQLAPFSNIEDVPVVPISNHAKEVTALPVNGEKLNSEEEIIIAQGGHDSKAIEKQIVAAEDGPVSVEEIQPTVSEAKKLAEEAHIPSDEIKAAPAPGKTRNTTSSKAKSSSSKADSKEKKKKGFFSKLKKIFK